MALARKRGVDVIMNAESKRETPAVVSYGDKMRFVGVEGAARLTMNVKNSVVQVKRLIGRKFADPDVQRDIEDFVFKVTEGPDGGCLVNVTFLGEPRQFTPEQIMTSLLKDLKAIAEADQGSTITDCAISVPVYFTEAERLAMLNAASLAGLKCLRLMNEPTAIALSWGIFKSDLPEDKPMHVAFVDVGHSSLQVRRRPRVPCGCVVAERARGDARSRAGVHRGVQEGADGGGGAQLGPQPGRPRPRQRALRALCGRVQGEARPRRGRQRQGQVPHEGADRKVPPAPHHQPARAARRGVPHGRHRFPARARRPAQLHLFCTHATPPSAAAHDTPGGACRSEMTRDKFEELAAPVLERVRKPVMQALEIAGIPASDVAAVEMCGAASRTPAMVKTVAEVFGQEPKRYARPPLPPCQCLVAAKRGCAQRVQSMMAT